LCLLHVWGFGYILTAEDLAKTFSGLRRHLVKDGLFIFEFWNVGGLKPTPYRSWMKTQNKDLTLYRLSESNFNPQTNVLTIDFHFVVISQNAVAETFTETHKIRCYTLAEMQHYLDNNGFELVSAYAWDSKDTSEFAVPSKETFRILTVSEKKRASHK
jgi:hypothetical protein